MQSCSSPDNGRGKQHICCKYCVAFAVKEMLGFLCNVLGYCSALASRQCGSRPPTRYCFAKAQSHVPIFTATGASCCEEVTIAEQKYYSLS